jgi:hypothetical protein
MTTFILHNSKSKSKKYDVYEYNTLKKVISFGASEYSDYPTHKDEARKEQYLKRHQKEDWNDLNKAGTWARFILWNKPTIRESILDMEHRFKIKII